MWWRYRNALFVFLMFVLGVVLGAYLFHDTRERSFLALPQCNDCLSKEELIGLLASIGIQKGSAFIPHVELETDQTVAIKSPEPLAKIDYVVFPKRDITHLGDVQNEDAAYITDAFLVMAQLVRRDNLQDYKVITNGPGFQQLHYLHFHLLAQ